MIPLVMLQLHSVSYLMMEIFVAKEVRVLGGEYLEVMEAKSGSFLQLLTEIDCIPGTVIALL
jgi:hypothetical protein